MVLESLADTDENGATAPAQFRVARRTLSKKLAATAEHAVTLVIAPAGFGKTTTLSEWCEVLRTRHQLVAWLAWTMTTTIPISSAPTSLLR